MSRVDHWASVRDRSTFRTLQPCASESLDIEALKNELDEQKKTVEELTAEIASFYPGWTFAGRNVAKAIAKLHGVSFIDLISQRRHRHLAWARQHAMWEMRQRTKLSLPQIGRILGNRDHTTVLHGIRRHEDRLASGRA